MQHRIRTLWLSGILHAFTHLYHVILLPLYYLMLKDPEIQFATVEQATSLMTILMISYYLPAYPVGVLADKYSKRKLLALGLVLNALGFIALSYAHTYSQAVCCMVLSGLGGSFYHPAATALVARLFPEATGKALGLAGVGASIGFFFGPIYSGWRGTHAGWRTPVFELGVAGVLMAILFYCLADEEPAAEQRTHTERPDGMFPSMALLGLFLVAALMFSLRDFAGASMGSLGSLFLQKAHGLGPELTGSILSTIFIASAVSNPLFGRLSDGHQTGWLTLVLSLAAVLVCVFPYVPPHFSPIALVIYGFFFMASFPMVEAVLMNAVPHHVRGRVFGVFITVGGFIGNLAHWFAGAYVKKLGPAGEQISSYYSIYLILGVFVALSLFGLPCLQALRRRETAAGEMHPLAHSRGR